MLRGLLGSSSIRKGCALPGRFCYVQPMKKNHVVLGLLMGAALGVVFGAALGNVGLGIPIGAGIGLVLGLVFRAASRKRKGTSA